VATIGEAGIAEVDAEVEAVAAVDDCVELEPHAATHAATTAATAMNRKEVHLCVLVFKILLPDPGWRLALTAGPDKGTADGMISRIRGRPSAGCSTSRVKQYQLRILDGSLDIPPCTQADQPRRVIWLPGQVRIRLLIVRISSRSQPVRLL
jgi:hypothetical protein